MTMMKILILNYEYPPIGGGAAPVSKDLASELVKAGNAVAVLTMKYGDMPEESNEDGVMVYRLPCLRKSKSSCSPLEQLSYLYSVRKFMKSHVELQKYDVCHAHFVVPTAEAARYIKKTYGIPYIITAHGSDVEGHNNKTSVMIMHRLLRSSWRKIVSDSFCTVSPSVYLMELMKSNFPDGRYRYIPNGVDYQLFESLNDRSKKEKSILVMGRIQRFKNVQFVIRAFSKIDGFNDWHINIVGDGPYRNELEKIISDTGVSDRVKMAGWLDSKSEQLLEYLRNASIYVSASQFENCPMSVIESTVAGCYPLVSDIPAHRQLLPEKHLFSLSDETELINKLKERMSYETGAFSLDMKRFNWKEITAQYEDVMHEAINACNPTNTAVIEK